MIPISTLKGDAWAQFNIHGTTLLFVRGCEFFESNIHYTHHIDEGRTGHPKDAI